METQQVSKLKQVGLACLLALVAGAASANDRDKAKRIHDRIAGVPPSEATLAEMEALVAGGNARAAADIATEAPSFYNVTLKNMAVPWTNRDQTVFAPLNDYVATFIGMVRDDVPFNTALSADLTYTVNGATPAASASNNDHYANAEANAVNLYTALQATASRRCRASRPRDRGLHHLARLVRSLLHRRHQPRDVPLHADESPVPRHGAGARHLAAAGHDPPGREPLAGW